MKENEDGGWFKSWLPTSAMKLNDDPSVALFVDVSKENDIKDIDVEVYNIIDI